MSTTRLGIKMINYTCYLTEDLLILANIAESATGVNNTIKEFCVDTYSKTENPKGGRRWRGIEESYTRHNCGSSEVRIVAPSYFKVGPVEALATAGESHGTVSQAMVADVLNSFARRCGEYKDISHLLKSRPSVKLRYGSRPEIKKPPVEGTAERRNRLINSKARHIRYALSSACEKTKNLRKMVKELNKYGKRSIINEEELDRTLKSLDSMYHVCVDLAYSGEV